MSAEAPVPWGKLVAASSSYIIWGLFPLFWKPLHHIPATELIAHRVVWAVTFLLCVVAYQGGFGVLRAEMSKPRNLVLIFGSAFLLTANWLVYIWGVNAGHVIDCSLGYFLVPLLNVLLGRYFLSEKLRVSQWTAIAFAAVGVAVLVWQIGQVPWIALIIAISFALYGYMRKKSNLGPLLGLTAETLLAFPFAAAYLAWRWRAGVGALGATDLRTTVLILSCGVVTAIPLLLFAQGARGLRMVTLGLLQYLTPTGQFLLGVLLYREAFSAERALAFVLIWIGLAIYSIEALHARARQKLALFSSVPIK